MRIFYNPILTRLICAMFLLGVPFIVLESPLLAWIPALVFLIGRVPLIWALSLLEILILCMGLFDVPISNLIHLALQSSLVSLLFVSPFGLMGLWEEADSRAYSLKSHFLKIIFQVGLLVNLVIIAGFAFRKWDAFILMLLLIPNVILCQKLRYVLNIKLPKLDKATLILFFVSLLVCIGILEVGLRLIIPVDSEKFDLFSAHPDYIYMLTPGFSAPLTFTPQDIKEPVKIDVTISSQGFRDAFLEPKQDNEFRVLMLGDSYTFGWSGSVNDAFPQQLQQLFSKTQTKKNVRIINGGMPGSGPWQHYGVLMERGLKIKPDMIIEQTNIANDLIDTSRRENFYLKTFILEQEQQMINYRLLSHPRFKMHDALRRNFRLYFVLDKITGSTPLLVDFMNQCRLFTPMEIPQVPAPLERPWNLEPDLVEWYPDLDRSWDMMQEDLLKFKDICEKQSIPLLMFNTVVPIDQKIDEARIEKFPEYKYELYKGYHLVQQFCEKNNITYIPLLEKFKEHPDRNALILEGDGHLSREGNALVAATIFQFLQSHFKDDGELQLF